MVQPFSKAFRDAYREAYQLFVDGKWGKAHQKFNETIALLDKEGLEDSLSKYHIDFMRTHDFIPPSTWAGYKDFDE